MTWHVEGMLNVSTYPNNNSFEDNFFCWWGGGVGNHT